MDGMGGERLGEAELRKGAEGGGTGANFSEAAPPHHTLCIRYTPHAVHMPHATRHARVAPPAPSCTCKGWCGVE